MKNYGPPEAIERNLNPWRRYPSRLSPRQCSLFVLMKQKSSAGEAQLYTLGLVEQLRAECGELWGASSNFYHRIDRLLRELANPNLHDIPVNLPLRVELWDRQDQHIRWVIAATSSVSIGHAALDTAIASYPDQRFTLRNGIQVIREHGSKRTV